MRCWQPTGLPPTFSQQPRLTQRLVQKGGIRVVLTARPSLPVYPDERTYSEPVGMSQRYQARKQRTYATGNKRGYLATCSFEIDVPICEKAAAIWLGWFSMKKLLAPLAQ